MVVEMEKGKPGKEKNILEIQKDLLQLNVLGNCTPDLGNNQWKHRSDCQQTTKICAF